MKDWALILGSSSGIGAECAKRLAKNGINIYGLYLRKRKKDIEILKEELSQHKVEVIFKKANASNEESRNDIVNELKNQGNIRIKMFIHSIAFGTLKNMVNISGDSLNKKNIEMTLDTMCNNIIYWTQDLLKAQLLKEGTHIIAMTSSGGRKNWPSYGAVSLAKAGLESVCRQLSLELAKYQISVNALQAGVTQTSALKKIPDHEKMIKNAIDNNPHNRLTTPKDIADFIEILLSYNSSWMTGNVIRIDGGEDITG
jgi:enoyl-[acyl-carrier protein] reductase III|tara:strand:- start:27 stop:794 length:768 start_codon:yes stop_codon:yes gene_type:complete